MLRYQEAEDLFNKARDKSTGKPIANNTRLIRSRDFPGSYAVKLHATEVVVIHPDGTFTLQTGGWLTVTTKDRINRYAPGSVYSDRGVWYYGTSFGQTRIENPTSEWQTHRTLFSRTWIFEDGIRVDGGGIPVCPVSTREEVRHFEKAKRKVDRMVAKYIRGYVEAIREQGSSFPTPSAGDCFGCCMVPADSKPKPTDYYGVKGVALSPQECMGVSHYFSHFREEYYVPSLLWRALQRRGNPAMVWHTITNYQADLAAQDLRWWFQQRKHEMARFLAQFEDLKVPEGY